MKHRTYFERTWPPLRAEKQAARIARVASELEARAVKILKASQQRKQAQRQAYRGKRKV